MKLDRAAEALHAEPCRLGKGVEFRPKHNGKSLEVLCPEMI